MHVPKENVVVLMLATAFILLALYFLRRNYRARKFKIQTKRRWTQLFSKAANSTEISRKDRAQFGQDFYGLAYGEIMFDGFSNLLAVVQPKAGEIFYDLGAGAGKAVLCAALLYPFKQCIGIELLPGLYQQSLAQLETLKNITTHSHSKIKFIQGDFLTHDISDAQVIFINATGFFERFWHRVAEKLETVKPGTRLIITSKQLDQHKYQLLDGQMVMMSWGMGSVRVYQKI